MFVVAVVVGGGGVVGVVVFVCFVLRYVAPFVGCVVSSCVVLICLFGVWISVSCLACCLLRALSLCLSASVLPVTLSVCLSV